ncbi:MAG: ATP-binding protein [Gemmatimonadota bacterium]
MHKEAPTAMSPAATTPRQQTAPPVPEELVDTGLSESLLQDLIIKTLYDMGARSGEELRGVIKLPFSLLDEQLLDLQQRRLLEVRGAGGQNRITYTFDLTGEGRERARELLATNGYVGPAPVPLDAYSAWVEDQTIQGIVVTADGIRDGFSHLVYDQEFLDQLGPGINSGLSLFLYGHSGNGKTTIAEAIAGMLGGEVYLPYALEVQGNIVVLYDPVYHQPVAEDGTTQDDPFGTSPLFRQDTPHDARYARIKRPVVFVGGEMTLEQLDLQYDPDSRIYQAPSHVKANGGVFILDDFGRQHVRPRDLLNRWMVPLEKRIDFLAFKNGYKFPIPFDCMLLFATNLNPLELVDEAFLRRIRYKILVESPSREQYDEIFRRCCENRDILFDRHRVEHVFRQYYARLQIAPRGCHPRDLVDTLCNVAKYKRIPPSLTTELLDEACRSYFLDMPGAGGVITGAGTNIDDE